MARALTRIGVGAGVATALWNLDDRFNDGTLTRNFRYGMILVSPKIMIYELSLVASYRPVRQLHNKKCFVRRQIQQGHAYH